MRNAILLIVSILAVGLVVFLFQLSGPSSQPPLSDRGADSGVAQSSVPNKASSLSNSNHPADGVTDSSNQKQSEIQQVQSTAQSAPELEPEVRDALDEMLNTSSDGLVEQKSDNGAVGVDLRGRFRTAPVATVDDDGEVQITDYTSLPSTNKE